MAVSSTAWATKLARLLETTPLATSLSKAVQPLKELGFDVAGLRAVLNSRQAQWSRAGTLGQLGLPESFMEFALAIHAYTLDSPNLYSLLNAAMAEKVRSEGPDGVSARLRAVLPFAKFLDAALCALPPTFAYRGKCYRGVKTVFPSPLHHHPERHFPSGSTVTFYEFKSASVRSEVMYAPHFCGKSGPRTIFTISRVSYGNVRKSYIN